MLRRTALLSALALPLAGCVTYDVTDRGAYYEVRDGAYYAPATASRGDYYLDRRPRTVVRYYDAWGPGPWAPVYGSRWAWSWRVGHGWGDWGPSWGSSIGWGWSSSPYWGSPWYGPGGRYGRYPGGTRPPRPVPPPHPPGEHPQPEPRPIIVEPPGPSVPVQRDGPRVDGEPRWGGGRRWPEPVLEPDTPTLPEREVPPIEAPRDAGPEPRFEEPTPRFEPAEPVEMPRMEPSPAIEAPIP